MAVTVLPSGALATAVAPLDHVDTWVFDLDNTLYPSACNLFDQVDRRMGEFISRQLGVDRIEARRIQKLYFHEYGTTLRGLMLLHGMAPAAFLNYVHDIDLTPVEPSPALDDRLDRLGGRKLVFTNGSAPHAERVLDRLGVARHFSGIFDIVAADYVPKPDPLPYARLVERFAIDPRRAAMVEDIARNLAPAHALGMTTVWLHSENDWCRPGTVTDHVHHTVDDLVTWLTAVIAAREQARTVPAGTAPAA